MSNQRQGVSPIAGIVAILFVFIMIWIAVSAVKGIFTILSWLALPLFVLALIMNYRVVTDYIQWIWRTIQKDTLKGLLYAGGSILGYPLVSAYLAFKAFTSRKFGKASPEKQKKGEYIKYEEVQEEDDFLELPELDKVKEKQTRNSEPSNDYDELFN